MKKRGGWLLSLCLLLLLTACSTPESQTNVEEILKDTKLPEHLISEYTWKDAEGNEKKVYEAYNEKGQYKLAIDGEWVITKDQDEFLVYDVQNKVLDPNQKEQFLNLPVLLTWQELLPLIFSNEEESGFATFVSKEELAGRNVLVLTQFESKNQEEERLVAKVDEKTGQVLAFETKEGPSPVYASWVYTKYDVETTPAEVELTQQLPKDTKVLKKKK